MAGDDGFGHVLHMAIDDATDAIPALLSKRVSFVTAAAACYMDGVELALRFCAAHPDRIAELLAYLAAIRGIDDKVERDLAEAVAQIATHPRSSTGRPS